MAEGATAIASKRVCALSSACKYVLWSDLTLAEIARRFGYTDGAHLRREFWRATGGLIRVFGRRGAWCIDGQVLFSPVPFLCC